MNRVWFTDRDLGKQFPGILAEAGLQVERHGDLFAPEGSDEQWLEHCGTNGRVAITHNSRIRYVPNELAAVKRFKVRLVVVVGQAPNAERRTGAQLRAHGAACRRNAGRTSAAADPEGVPGLAGRVGEVAGGCGERRGLVSKGLMGQGCGSPSTSAVAEWSGGLKPEVRHRPARGEHFSLDSANGLKSLPSNPMRLTGPGTDAPDPCHMINHDA